MAQEKNAIPLMILSDSPTAGTGFARIANDLATRITTHLPDVYRVCTFGYGGMASRNLPFHQYTIENMHDWYLPTLPETWRDWAGNEQGILLTIWDISRLNWLAQPNFFPETFEGDQIMLKWLNNRPFKLWGYVPIDASGPNDRLTFPLMRALLGFDRLLAYTEFGEGVIRRTLGNDDADRRALTFMPHGINAGMFHEADRPTSRSLFFSTTAAQTGRMMLGHSKAPEPIKDSETLIGIVATNQSRKDWALGIETASFLTRRYPIRIWIHTDSLERYWSIPSLLADYGLLDKAIITMGYLPDHIMAACYSACDITLGIGLGEGFGYPIQESMFCGTPCIHGDYGGGAEWLAQRVLGFRIADSDEPLLVKPVTYRYEGSYACKRPVFRAEDWAAKARRVIGKRVNHSGELDWNTLWPRWEAYLRGAAEF